MIYDKCEEEQIKNKGLNQYCEELFTDQKVKMIFWDNKEL
jgi:hypothetical protein